MRNKVSNLIESVQEASRALNRSFQDPMVRKTSRRAFIVGLFASAAASTYLRSSEEHNFLKDLEKTLFRNIEEISYNEFTQGLDSETYKKLYLYGRTAYLEGHDGSYAKVGLPSEQHIGELINSGRINLDKIALYYNEKINELHVTPSSTLNYAHKHPDAIAAYLFAYHTQKELRGAMFDYKGKNKIEREARRVCPDNQKLHAYHEAGHAIILYLKPGIYELGKASIKYNERSYGRVEQITPYNIRSSTKEMLDNELESFMAGRAAEIIINGEKGYTTAACGDIRAANELAEEMVRAGMSEQLGPVYYPPRDKYVQSRFKSLFSGSTEFEPYTEERRIQIENTRDEMVKNALDNAIGFLREYKNVLHAVAQELIKYKELEPEHIKEIINQKMSELNTQPELS